MSNNSAPMQTLAPFEFVDLNERIELYAGVVVGSSVGFVLFIAASYFFFRSSGWCPPRIQAVFLSLSEGERADWCSRCSSMLHAFVVCPAFAITLALTPWDEPQMVPLTDAAVKIRCIMAVSVAYFIVDLPMIMYYKVPLWGVFVGHHVTALIPLVNQLFNKGCPRATFDLGLFLLVEFATIFVNFQSYLETLGQTGTPWHTRMIYATYLSWIATRVVMPLWIMWHLYTTIFLDKLVAVSGCMIAPFVAAHGITLFCVAVFLFVLTPAMYRRWVPLPPADTEPGGEQPSGDKAGGAAAAVPPMPDLQDTGSMRVVSPAMGSAAPAAVPDLNTTALLLAPAMEHSASADNLATGTGSNGSTPLYPATSRVYRSGSVTQLGGFGESLSHDQLSVLGHL